MDRVDLELYVDALYTQDRADLVAALSEMWRECVGFPTIDTLLDLCCQAWEYRQWAEWEPTRPAPEGL
jgi:hypothetical protein